MTVKQGIYPVLLALVILTLWTYSPGERRDHSVSASPKFAAPAAVKLGSNQERKPSTVAEVTVLSAPDKEVLNHFIDLKAKAIRTRNEELEVQALLSDEAFLDQITENLISIEEKQFSSEYEKRRFNQIFFLEQAARWKDNPQRNQVISKLEKVIEAQNLVATTSEPIQKSVIGDKIELYRLLKEQAPERAERLRKSAVRPSLQAILAFSEASE